MAKNLVFGTMDDEFIDNLNAYTLCVRTLEEYKALAKEALSEIEAEKKKILDKRQKLLEDGVPFDQAMEQTAIFDNILAAENKINDKLAEVSEPVREAKKALIKALNLSELYNAYFVGVAKTDYTATGAIDFVNKNGKVKSYACERSLADQVSEWFTSYGIKNSENQAAVAKFLSKNVLPFVGTKLDKRNTDIYGMSKTAFQDAFIVSLKKALVNINFFVQNEDGSVSRKAQAQAEE